MLVYPVKFLPRGESTSPSYITTQIVKERIPTDLDQGTNGSGVCHCRLSPGGARRDRTADPLLAKQVLSQLSYGPVRFPVAEIVVGLGRFELPTSPLSGVRSNQLSYRPADRSLNQADCVGAPVRLDPVSFKGGDPAAGSPTATLLRLHPSHEPHRGKRPPEG